MLGTLLKKTGFAVAVLGLGATGIGVGTANAAPATNVFSDLVNFTAQLVPSSPPGTYTLQNKSCKLKSDGETKGFACQVSGTVTPSSPTGTIQVTFTSADGTTTSSTFPVTFSSTGTFKGKGPGTENDAPDPGQPPPGPYPCIVKIKGSISGSGLMTGVIRVLESSTQP